MSWHLGRMTPFDLETTGTDPETAQIVDVYVGLVGGGAPAEDVLDQVVNPGVEVPEAAARIHGLTTAEVRARGVDAKGAVEDIVTALAAALHQGVPIVGHNICYDLTVIDREARRHGVKPLVNRVKDVAPVLCTQTLSTHVDQFRRRSTDINPTTEKPYGAQTLRTTALAFGVAWNDSEAHGARYDALVSARVAWRIGQIAAMPNRDRPRADGRQMGRFNDVAVPLARLHAEQTRWAAEQADRLARHFRDQARAARTSEDQLDWTAKAESVTGWWPMVPVSARQESLMGGAS